MRFFKPWFPRLPAISAADVADAIDTHGTWTRHQEWRISTVTSTTIERTDSIKRHERYKVRVECDYVFEADCPTLARALEIAARYEQLTLQLWREMGWPSWATRWRLEPGDDEL
jgi:hypothetical protein